MRKIIELESVSKEYRLGQIGFRTLRDDLAHWWATVRGKESPVTKIHKKSKPKGDGSYFWALKDISFSIFEGQTVGLIGPNGAGKSTLLKVVSRVTAPTQGRIKLNGRVAGLLEVGTGFHSELTGRDNVYLRGTLLGMSKKEIDRKFDEIVDFSGVEQYIETPIKRYSSGMQVRLGFAVAAFLDPELLLVDEVLSVGDAEFREKSVAKMHELAQSGRTIIFVSHNLDIVSQLCPQTMLLWKGELVGFGETNEIIYSYREKISDSSSVRFDETDDNIGVRNITIQNLEMIVNGELSIVAYTMSEVTFASSLQRKNSQAEDDVLFQLTIISDHYQKLTQLIKRVTFAPGVSTVKVECNIPNFPLLAGRYFIDIAIFQNGVVVDKAMRAIGFDVIVPKDNYQMLGKGTFLIPAKWNEVIQ
ncbi:MAG TPA: polysaccharide ABC transporter ATP-binding protein [Anaerolineales bacterium]|nr:polysaccharide ABC transporter ATP-binding protein [Anaerolineales bacterium]